MQPVRADGARTEQRLGQVDIYEEAELVVGHTDSSVLLAGQCHQRLADRVAKRIYQHVDVPKPARLASTARRTSSGFGDVGDGGDHAPPGRRRDLRRRPLDVRRRQSIECDIGTRLGAAAERPAAMRPPKLRL